MTPSPLPLYGRQQAGQQADFRHSPQTPFFFPKRNWYPFSDGTWIAECSCSIFLSKSPNINDLLDNVIIVHAREQRGPTFVSLLIFKQNLNSESRLQSRQWRLMQ